MGAKVGFTNCVFEKLCFAENTIFIVFSEKHSFSETKYACWTKQKIYEKLWVVFEHGKMVFWGFLFFEVLMLLWCLFGVSGIVPKVFKMLVFPHFVGAFVGWVIFVYLGLEVLGVLVFLCLFFFFCVGFVSVLFALFLFSCWIVFGVGSCFVFVFYFIGAFVFCLFLFFFGGFKGQVRWPKGPPHLALNPPYFIWFVFLFFGFCFYILFCFLFLSFVFSFFGRVYGSGEVAQRATSLGPKPSSCFLFSFIFISLFSFLCFPFFVFNRKTLLSHWKRPFWSVYLCFPLFLFSLFWTSPFFPFLFLCLSLCLSLSCSFLSSCVPVFHFCFWFLLFLSVYLLFLPSCSFVFLFSACCLVLFWIIRFDLFLFCILFSCCCFCFLFLDLVFCYFWFLETNQKTSLKNGNSKNSKNEKCRKKRHFDKSN